VLFLHNDVHIMLRESHLDYHTPAHQGECVVPCFLLSQTRIWVINLDMETYVSKIFKEVMQNSTSCCFCMMVWIEEEKKTYLDATPCYGGCMVQVFFWQFVIWGRRECSVGCAVWQVVVWWSIVQVHHHVGIWYLVGCNWWDCGLGASLFIVCWVILMLHWLAVSLLFCGSLLCRMGPRVKFELSK
jgi:hypothetical protein